MTAPTIEQPRVAAMIFAAGLGTRLYPLTKDRPKALVALNGTPLIDLVIQRITESGIRKIVVNVHHFSDLLKEYLAAHTYDAEILISDESDILLDTGGGLKRAEPLFTDAEHILLHNVDIISNININQLIDNHIASGAMATLAVRARKTSRYLLFDNPTQQLCGWENVKTGEKRMVRPSAEMLSRGFSGIHVVRRDLLNHIPANEKLSMTPLYLNLAAQFPIRGYDHTPDQWQDMGKYEDFC